MGEKDGESEDMIQAGIDAATNFEKLVRREKGVAQRSIAKEIVYETAIITVSGCSDDSPGQAVIRSSVH